MVLFNIFICMVSNIFICMVSDVNSMLLQIFITMLSDIIISMVGILHFFSSICYLIFVLIWYLTNSLVWYLIFWLASRLSDIFSSMPTDIFQYLVCYLIFCIFMVSYISIISSEQVVLFSFLSLSRQKYNLPDLIMCIGLVQLYRYLYIQLSILENWPNRSRVFSIY